MKNIYNIFLTTMLLTLSGCGEDQKKNTTESSILGEAIITIYSKTFTIPIQTCSEPSTKTYEGEVLSRYIIYAKPSDDKKHYPTLHIEAEKEAGAFLTFITEENGTELTHTTKIPYSSFDGKKLNFKGKVKKGVMFTSNSTDVPFELKIRCNQ